MNLIYNYLNLEFKIKGDLRVLLTTIFGIGFNRASYLCDSLGFMKGCSALEISKYQFSLIIGLIKRYYLIDIELKRELFNRLKWFLSLKSLNSLRYRYGLPIRGQGTHTNARTTRMRNNFLTDL